MTSKWANVPLSAPRPSAPSPTPSSAHSADLLSLLNTGGDRTPVPVHRASATQANTVDYSHGEAGSDFVYSGRDSDLDQKEESGKARTWSSGTAESEEMHRDAHAPSSASSSDSPSSSPRDRLFLSPESRTSTSPLQYSKHAPPGYKYTSTSAISSPSTSPSFSPQNHYPPLFNDQRSPSAIAQNIAEEQSIETSTGPEARQRVQDALTERTRSARPIPLGASAGTLAMSQGKGQPSPVTSPRFVGLITRHDSISSSTSSPSPSLTFAQLKAAEERATRLQAEKNDLASHLDGVRAAAKQAEHDYQARQSQAEKVICHLQREVTETDNRLMRRLDDAVVAIERVHDLEARLAEATQEIVRLENELAKQEEVVVDFERLRDELASLKTAHESQKEEVQGMEKQKKVLEESLMTTREELHQAEDRAEVASRGHRRMSVKRDVFKLAVADKIQVLATSHTETADVRAALSASEDRNLHEERQHRLAIDLEKQCAAEDVAIAVDAKQTGVVQVRDLELRLSAVQKELEAANEGKKEVEAALGKERQLFSRRNELLRAHSAKEGRQQQEEIDRLKNRLAAFEQGSHSLLTTSTTSAAHSTASSATSHEQAPRIRCLSPGRLLDLSQSPLVDESPSITGSLPLEIRSTKPPELYEDPSMPGRRLVKLQVQYALLDTPLHSLQRHLVTLEQEKHHLENQNEDLAAEKLTLHSHVAELEEKVDKAYCLMQDVLNEQAIAGQDMNAGSSTQLQPLSLINGIEAPSTASSSSAAELGFFAPSSQPREGSTEASESFSQEMSAWAEEGKVDQLAVSSEGLALSLGSARSA
ncbi:hypothetical protein JCM11641_007296 [Rhodosporidiobolus odoratus]